MVEGYLTDGYDIEPLSQEEIDKLLTAIPVNRIRTEVVDFRRYIEELDVNVRSRLLEEFWANVGGYRRMYINIIRALSVMRSGKEEYAYVPYNSGDVLVENLTEGQILSMRKDCIDGINICNSTSLYGRLNMEYADEGQANEFLRVARGVAVVIKAIRPLKDEYMEYKIGFNSSIVRQISILDGTEPCLQKFSFEYLLGNLSLDAYEEIIREFNESYRVLFGGVCV